MEQQETWTQLAEKLNMEQPRMSCNRECQELCKSYPWKRCFIVEINLRTENQEIFIQTGRTKLSHASKRLLTLTQCKNLNFRKRQSIFSLIKSTKIKLSIKKEQLLYFLKPVQYILQYYQRWSSRREWGTPKVLIIKRNVTVHICDDSKVSIIQHFLIMFLPCGSLENGFALVAVISISSVSVTSASNLLCWLLNRKGKQVMKVMWVLSGGLQFPLQEEILLQERTLMQELQSL